MCEPQSVSTALTYFGLFLSLMSKIRTPSHDSLTDATCPMLLQESLLREESTAVNSRSP